MKRLEHAGSFLLGLIVYAILVSAYYFLVLNFLGSWIMLVFVNHKLLYAGLALGLISAQGLLLEMVTSKLLNTIRSRES